MSKQKRSDVPVELTWDLSDLFADEAAFTAALESLEPAVGAFADQYETNIESLDTAALTAMLEQYETLLTSITRCQAYAELDRAVDYTDPEKGRRQMLTESVLSPLHARLSFVQSELSLLDEQRLALLLETKHGAFARSLLARKRHLFSPESERILAELGILSSLPYTVYETAKLADLSFDDFTADGRAYPLSYSLYETTYCQETDTAVRRSAFDAFYDQIGRCRHTMATAYYTEVKAQCTEARLRGFDSVFDMLLLPQEVKRDVYERHLDVLKDRLPAVMRRYAEKLAGIYGLDRLHFADLKLFPARGGEKSASIEEAKHLTEKTARLLGDDYTSLVMRAFPERWVDFVQNEGKSTGGFCAQPPESHAYILMNWNGHLSEVFTLVHELGHAAQGMLSSAKNSLLSVDPSLYMIEAPSTLNELLLTDALLAEDDSAETRRLTASLLIANTYFHNCVTHLLEAFFQRDVYRAVERGESLSADDFDRLFHDVLTAFWGDAVEIPALAGRTWMRQPHYYMGLYPYTYSAGLVVATAVSRRIREEGAAAAEDWLAMLEAGGSLPPFELAGLAGVDLGSDGPLNLMVDRIAELVEAL